jgi:hypothetical protein
MVIKRVSSGRLSRVEQRRRGKKWRVVVGVLAAAAFVAIVALAYHYKTRTRRPTPPAVTATATAETVATAETAVAAEPPAEDGVRTLLVNATKVPQRYGNALAALEEYNAAGGSAFHIEQIRPKIAYTDKSIIFFGSGFESRADELASALAMEVPRQRVDVTVICGQDISKLILEALAKKVPAPEGVNVEVLNGCGIEGAASKMKERLEDNGYAVVALGNAPTFDYRATVIQAGEENEYAAHRLAELFGLDADRLEPRPYDLKVVIGDDYAVAPETP